MDTHHRFFFDLEDYIYNKCTDANMRNEFSSQLNRTVLFKCQTQQYFSALKGVLPINHYSGITTSDPSNNRLTNSKNTTQWYKATH